MKKISILCVSLFAIAVQSLAQVSVVGKGADYIDFDVALPSVNKKIVSQQGQKYYSITAAGATPWVHAQHPNVLKYMLRVALPNTSDATATILSENHTDHVLPYHIAPSAGSQVRTAAVSLPMLQEGEVYKKAEFFPQQVINPSNTYAMRSQRGQNFALAFTQYNPATKVLRTYTNMRVRVHFNIPVQQSQIPAFVQKEESEQMLAVLKNKFDNFDPSEYTALTQYGDMLVVCPPQYVAIVKPFVDWKNQKGIKTILVTTDSISQTVGGVLETAVLDAFIKTYYAANPKLLYVQLVGSHLDIETQRISYASQSNRDYYGDNRYGYITGNDAYAEVLVGRFFGKFDEEIALQVQKAIQYEKTTLGGDWLRHYTALGSNDPTPADDGQQDWQHERDIADSMINHGTYTKKWELYDGTQGDKDAAGAPSPTMLAACIDSGTSFINYTGHGNVNSLSTTAFTSAEAAQLNNTGGMWPAMLAVGCNTGQFETPIPSKCLGHAFATASKNVNGINLPTGTIVNAMSSEEQWWECPPQCQDEAMAVYRGARPGNVKNAFGSIMQCGWASMLDQYSAAAGWTFPDDGAQTTDSWQVFGDISVVLNSANLGTLSCYHPNYINVNETSFLLGCTVNDADVTLSHRNRLVATTKSFGGYANFTLPSGLLSVGDSIFITATKHNYNTHQQAVFVVNWPTSLSQTVSTTVSIVPNPTSSKFIVQTRAMVTSVDVTDLAGRIVLHSTQREVNVAHLQAGLYAVVVHTEAGDVIQKLLKQ